MSLHSRIHQAISDHRLPSDFSETVSDFYAPLVNKLHQDINQLAKTFTSPRPQFIGIQGSQGSGKSTCAEFLKILLETEYDLRVLVVSIDDFYLTLAERQNLSEIIHPLLLTRGVPGTHDVKMMNDMFDRAQQQQHFSVPRFNKALDDRDEKSKWQVVDYSLDVVILEGWCVGIPAQEIDALSEPKNKLEEKEDNSGEWRNWVNDKLSNEYHDLYARLDHIVALQVPSFDCVFEWRLLQEQKMIERLTKLNQDTSKAQTPEQLTRFIAHYQRLTEHACVVMPNIANYVLWIDGQHRITKLTEA